ncbi:hypothetical protein TNIN_122211 [Trichonephila inaurata madagascariensis]|uniref:Uncharacterized protein n=1 Tax=Trichonephila inaurata madagascariensis TaxID=2747483 RepID=A0A8X6Y7H9_9ARAC|nr:hypothetical protein TNIN_122211 [Trichonephila inaurata madagascariensis]
MRSVPPSRLPVYCCLYAECSPWMGKQSVPLVDGRRCWEDCRSLAPSGTKNVQCLAQVYEKPRLLGEKPARYWIVRDR